MTLAAERHRDAQRGAALLVAVMLVAALSILGGAVGAFALLESQTAAAARAHAEAAAAAEAGLEIAAGSLAAEPDLAAVRLGLAAAAANGAPGLATADGWIDVATLSGRLARRRARLPLPARNAEWQPYLWGRLGELLPTPVGMAGRDPLIVVWVRADDSGLPPHRLELAVEAVTPSGARAAAVAVADVGPRGAAIEVVWPEVGPAGPP
jgi:hypothetical protein